MAKDAFLSEWEHAPFYCWTALYSRLASMSDRYLTSEPRWTVSYLVSDDCSTTKLGMESLFLPSEAHILVVCTCFEDVHVLGLKSIRSVLSSRSSSHLRRLASSSCIFLVSRMPCIRRIYYCSRSTTCQHARPGDVDWQVRHDTASVITGKARSAAITRQVCTIMNYNASQTLQYQN